MTELSLERIMARLRGRAAAVLPRAEGAKQAAVAAVLRPSGPDDAEVLLIRRAESPNDPWSGHMAFPGGRYEPDDPDLVGTAVRETREEVGLDLAREARLVGALDELEAIARGRRTGMVIRPYVFVVDATPRLEPNVEVAEVVWAPLGAMVRGHIDTTLRFARDGFDVELPGYDVGGRTVWGLTYEMLQTFFRAVRTG